jgi:hypothetical protein
MSNRPPFEFDISASADKKRRKTGRRGFSGAFETSNKGCEYPACKEAGAYRAPKSPDLLDEYYWFCKDHVREYNLKWNFFNGTTDEEFQKFLEKDRVWGRETKPFSQKDDGRAWQRLGVDDPMACGGDTQAAADGTQGAGGSGCARYLDQDGNPQAIQRPGEGSSSRYERR